MAEFFFLFLSRINFILSLDYFVCTYLKGVSIELDNYARYCCCWLWQCRGFELVVVVAAAAFVSRWLRCAVVGQLYMCRLASAVILLSNFALRFEWKETTRLFSLHALAIECEPICVCEFGSAIERVCVSCVCADFWDGESCEQRKWRLTSDVVEKDQCRSKANTPPPHRTIKFHTNSHRIYFASEHNLSANKWCRCQWLATTKL